jgi:hypothetical protein
LIQAAGHLGRPAQVEQHHQHYGSRTLVGAVCQSKRRLGAPNVYTSGGFKTALTIQFLRLVRRAFPEKRVVQ